MYDTFAYNSFSTACGTAQSVILNPVMKAQGFWGFKPMLFPLSLSFDIIYKLTNGIISPLFRDRLSVWLSYYGGFRGMLALYTWSTGIPYSNNRFVNFMMSGGVDRLRCVIGALLLIHEMYSNSNISLNNPNIISGIGCFASFMTTGLLMQSIKDKQIQYQPDFSHKCWNSYITKVTIVHRTIITLVAEILNYATDVLIKITPEMVKRIFRWTTNQCYKMCKFGLQTVILPVIGNIFYHPVTFWYPNISSLSLLSHRMIISSGMVNPILGKNGMMTWLLVILPLLSSLELTYPTFYIFNKLAGSGMFSFSIENFAISNLLNINTLLDTVSTIIRVMLNVYAGPYTNLMPFDCTLNEELSMLAKLIRILHVNVALSYTFLMAFCDRVVGNHVEVTAEQKEIRVLTLTSGQDGVTGSPKPPIRDAHRNMFEDFCPEAKGMFEEMLLEQRSNETDETKQVDIGIDAG